MEDAVPLSVLRFFDALTLARADLRHIVQVTSTWLDRPVAVRSDDGVVAVDGGEWSAVWPEDSTTMTTRDGVVVGLGGPAADGDRAVLERLAVCVTLALGEDGATADPGRSVQALVEGSAAVRRSAAQRLGLRSETPVRLLAAHGSRDATDAWVAALEADGTTVHRTEQRRLTLLVTVGGRVPALVQEGVPRGLRLGISREFPAGEAPAALVEARAAFRFSQPSPRDAGPYLIEEGVGFEYWRLRGYEALADALTPDIINRMQDVQALDRALETSGPEMLRTLDVVVAATSIREAARSLETHHNSVAHRVAAAEQAFGFSLADRYGRSRLYLAIVLRRLRETHALVR